MDTSRSYVNRDNHPIADAGAGSDTFIVMVMLHTPSPCTGVRARQKLKELCK